MAEAVKNEVGASETPFVSVVLPVYNGEPYLAEAVESILGQTYAHFELIVIDDGSKDGSAAVVEKISDPRLKFIRQANQGLAATLNRGIGLAGGKYIARQDQDDVSRPERFARQVEYLESHPGCALIGTGAEIWVGGRKTGRTHRHPTASHILKFDLLFDNPFVHSSVMIRKSALDKAGLYTTDPSRQPPEDYELWSRLAREFEVGNLAEILHAYREVPRSMSRVKANPFLEKVIKVSSENIAWYLGEKSPGPEAVELAGLGHFAPSREPAGADFARWGGVLAGLAGKIAANAGEQRDLEKRAARLVSGWRWRYVARKYAPAWLKRLKHFVGSLGRG